MDTESENESMEGDLNAGESTGGKNERADWGKAKYDYYYTDYVDKDYPSKLSAKEERLAAIEQEEALRIQKKLLSTIDNAGLDLHRVIDENESDESQQENLIDLIERQNKTLLLEQQERLQSHGKKRPRVQFKGPVGDEECEFDDEEEDQDDEDTESQDDQGEDGNGRKRRPINMAIKKNRGLTPYKKKEYRNPRVKHKLKFKKAMTKRRRLVKEAQSEFHRYSGEATGIKTSTIKSIKLC